MFIVTYPPSKISLLLRKEIPSNVEGGILLHTTKPLLIIQPCSIGCGNITSIILRGFWGIHSSESIGSGRRKWISHVAPAIHIHVWRHMMLPWSKRVIKLRVLFRSRYMSSFHQRPLHVVAFRRIG